MLTPTNVKPIVCSGLGLNILANDSSQDGSITELTKGSFYESTDYRKVYKNFNYNKSYDALIYEGNQEDKIAGHKMFQSYPYDKVEFKIGDYIHWDYNQDKYSTWILISLDTQYLYNVKGRMVLCNNTLKWKNNKGQINCYPCAIKDALTYTNFKWGNVGVVQPGGDIVVIIQKNEDTEKININDRFLFGNVAFQVKQFFDELNPNYMQLYMRKIPELQDDNFEEDIAINEEPENISSKNGIVLEPDVDEILLEESVEFNVYNYIGKIKQDNTFTVNVSKVPTDSYELEIINGNQFKITNLKQYNKNTMSIECIDNKTNEKIIKEIWLGGNW